MPWFIVWLDWCFYAHFNSLLYCTALVSAHYYFTAYSDLARFDFQLVLLASLCLWVVCCILKNGYAVG